MDFLNEEFSNLQVEDREDLIIVASTFMDKELKYECVMAWSEEENRLVRPVTNLHTNSWDSGTFAVGCTYEFVILNRNPESDKPHKSEDILVANEESNIPTPRDGQRSETEMYEMLESSSMDSVTDLFPDVVKENKYIVELTDCRSAGILSCRVRDIRLYMNDWGKERCEIFQDYDFPITAKNRESVKTGLTDCSPDDPLLVLLGLGRAFAGSEPNHYNPRRCYIMVIGIIRKSQ